MAQAYELNLRDYWNIFLKRRLIVAISFLSVFFAIFLYTNFRKQIYAATVIIKIDPSIGVPSEVVFPSRPMYWIQDNLTDYTTQITSNTILALAAKELNLINDKMSDKEKNFIIIQLQNNVEAFPIEKTHMLKLRVYSEDPQRAADLANKIASIFKRINLEQKNQQAHNVRVFIENTLSDVSKKLKEQDERLRELTMRGVLGLGVNTVNQIYELEQRRAELLTKFTQIHPEVIRLDTQVAELKKNLKNLPKEEFEYGVLKRDININETLYTSLKQKLPEAQIKEAEKVDNVLLVNVAIPPRYPAYPDKRKNYLMGIILGLVLGVTMALVTEHMDTSIGRVEEIENFIKVSVLGVIPFFTIKDKDEDKDKEAKGWKKIFFKKKQSKREIFYKISDVFSEYKTKSIFLEALRILGVNLQVILGKGGKIKNKILLLTSCNPEEGKSIVTANLGIIMSQMGYKVLVIDADTRRAAIHKIFGLKHKEDGLLDILMDKISPEAAIKTVTDLMLGEVPEGSDQIMEMPWLNNFNILTSGSVFPNPVNLFNSEKMDEVLNYFKHKYDLVLIDSSPILAVSEPSILIPKVDGILLVYRAGATSRIALRRAKIQVESLKNPAVLLGIVLNNVTPEVGIDTYYYYNKRYYGTKEKPSKDL